MASRAQRRRKEARRRQHNRRERPTAGLVWRDGVKYLYQTTGHTIRSASGQMIPNGVLTLPVCEEIVPGGPLLNLPEKTYRFPGR
jgi:hypothetical protein